MPNSDKKFQFLLHLLIKEMDYGSAIYLLAIVLSSVVSKFWKGVAHLGQWLTILGGSDQIQAAQNKQECIAALCHAYEISLTFHFMLKSYEDSWVSLRHLLCHLLTAFKVSLRQWLLGFTKGSCSIINIHWSACSQHWCLFLAIIILAVLSIDIFKAIINLFDIHAPVVSRSTCVMLLRALKWQ